MDRYRQYGVLDEPPISDGDVGFLGVNEWDTAANLEPGQVQAAVNIDFTAQTAATRGGFVCLPALGASSFNNSTAWTQRTISTTAYWMSATYADGRFVAMRGQGNAGSNDVLLSADGITWSAVSSGIAQDFRAIAYGNGLYVAVGLAGANHIATSPSGSAWTARTSPDSTYNLLGVAYGNGVFVAVGYKPAGSDDIFTSPDGVTWTKRSTGLNAGGFGWNGVIYGGGQFVAVRNSGFGTAGQSMVSSDGITWTNGGSIAGAWCAVAYGSGMYVMVASNGGVASSTNGTTWTSRTPISAGLAWNAVVFGNNQFVAVNSTGTAATAIMTSPNGTTWSAATAPNTLAWYGLAYGNGTFVATSAFSGSSFMTKSYYTTANTAGAVLASGIYSDPNDPGSRWIMLVGTNTVGFYAFGKTSRSVAIDSTYTVTQQSTVVQCNNQVYLFRGATVPPLYWDGNWAGQFTLAPTANPMPAGFSGAPYSNQATYYQNRLWVIDGKDTVAASDVLDFTAFDQIAESFNVNTGSSDYLVTTYPFGDRTLIVFKNNSILALNSVSGALTAVTCTEITRTVGCVGINAVTTVGPDLCYVSGRNINLLSLTSTDNSVQHKTLPLSRNIRKLFQRVNWQYGYKISISFWNNKLFVALPLDGSTVCNAVTVYNFVTEQWYGEWAFSSAISMNIQGWVIATYLGEDRLHCITEDGRIFVTDEGFYDISGSTLADISTSVTTRAYRMNNDNRVNRRMWMDLATNRPNFSVTAYADGVGESSTILSNQTYSRSASWIFSDSTYSLTNSGDNYNRQGRKDYAGLCAESIQCQSGFLPEALQEYRLPLITRRKGRLCWFKVDNTQGKLVLNGIGAEARPGDRGNLIQVI